MSTVLTGSQSHNPYLLVGAITENKANRKELSVTDAIGREIIHAEVLTADEVAQQDTLGSLLNNLVEVEVHTYSADSESGVRDNVQRVFVKVNSIHLGNEAFKSKLNAHMPGWISYAKGEKQESLFKEVMGIQEHQSLKNFEAVHAKLENLKGLNLNTKDLAEEDWEVVDAASSKGYFQISEKQLFQLVTLIEQNREDWLNESADIDNGWIEKKVHISGIGNIKIEIYPENRPRRNKLGRIDVRLDMLGRGGSKKAFRILHYDTHKVTAGKYVSEKDSYVIRQRGGDPFDPNREVIERELEVDRLIKKDAKGDKTAHRNLDKSKEITYQTRQKRIKIDNSIEPQIRTKAVHRLYDPNGFSKLINDKNVPIKIKTEIVIQILEALETLHSKGIVHKDIKPDNIFIKHYDDGRIKVVVSDFGISEKKGERSPYLTGTLDYISPEDKMQAALGMPITHSPQSDLFAVGVTMKPLRPNGNADIRPSEEPKKKDSYKWGLWKLSNSDPNQRFQTATEAKIFFLNILKREIDKESKALLDEM